MIPCNYAQVGVFSEGKCIAISGYWLGTKLWCGPYLELDNVIVCEAARGTGAGKLIQQYLEEKAQSLNCSIMALDAYTNNFKAHRFYYNQGYAPKGFHFVKILDKNRLT
ncbi:aminoalkylphosphonic acid N-acetyltransferase [compost metagenome]